MLELLCSKFLHWSLQLCLLKEVNANNTSYKSCLQFLSVKLINFMKIQSLSIHFNLAPFPYHLTHITNLTISHSIMIVWFCWNLALLFRVKSFAESSPRWRHRSAFAPAPLSSLLNHHDILTHSCVLLQYLFHEMAIDEDLPGGYLQPCHSHITSYLSFFYVNAILDL